MALTWSRSIEWDLADWRSNAACRDTDPDLFFPVGTTGPAIEQIESAKAVCQQCEAQAACLEFARSLGRVDLVGMPYGREAVGAPSGRVGDTAIPR